MTIVKVSDRGVRNSTGTGTATLTLTNPTLITPGNYLVVRVAVDNSGASGALPGLAVSDSRSHTWTVGTGALQDPGAASAGSACYLCYVKVRTAFQAADTVVFTWTTGTPVSAIVVEEWTGIHSVTPLDVAQVTANNVSSTAQPAISITPTGAGHLVYVACAAEQQGTEWGAQDSDTTNGSWVDLTKDAANTGTHDTSMAVYGGYKIVTASGAQTWNNTLSVTGDWAACAVVFDAELSLPEFARRPRFPVLRGWSSDNEPYTLPRARSELSVAALAYVPPAADDILPAPAAHLVAAVDDVPSFRRPRPVNPALYAVAPVVRTATAFATVYARATGTRQEATQRTPVRVIQPEPAYILRPRRFNPALFLSGTVSGIAKAASAVYARATGAHKVTVPQKAPAAVIVRATGAAVSSGTKQGIAKAALSVIGRPAGTHKTTRAFLAPLAVVVRALAIRKARAALAVIARATGAHKATRPAAAPSAAIARPAGTHKTSRPLTARLVVVARATGAPVSAGTKQGVCKAVVAVTSRPTGTHKATARPVSAQACIVARGAPGTHKATARPAAVQAAVIARPTGTHRGKGTGRAAVCVYARPAGLHKTTRAARAVAVGFASASKFTPSIGGSVTEVVTRQSVLEAVTRQTVGETVTAQTVREVTDT
jgi:hypothetical protein